MTQEQIKRAAEAIRNSNAWKYIGTPRGSYYGVFCIDVNKEFPNLEDKEVYGVVNSALDRICGKGNWEQFTDADKKQRVRIVSGKSRHSQRRQPDSVPPKTYASWSKLPDGKWGVLGPQSMMKEGEIVEAKTKGGKISTQVVGEFVSKDDTRGTSLHRLAAKKG